MPIMYIVIKQFLALIVGVVTRFVTISNLKKNAESKIGMRKQRQERLLMMP